MTKVKGLANKFKSKMEEAERRIFRIHGRKYSLTREQLVKEMGCPREDLNELWKAGKRTRK